MLNRRRLLQIAGLSPFAAFTPAWAETLQARHATSLFGEVKYGADFTHFDYVNPNAPKGGKVRLKAFGTYDSLNAFTIKGTPAGPGINDTLMTRSLDEASTMYGLIAQSMSYPEDKSSVVFTLNPKARFHDGKQISPEDVIFSMATVKANLPNYAAYFANVAKVEKTGDNEVTFFFNEKNNRELPHIVAELPILPKHWWEGTDAMGKKRDTNEASMEFPLGSGAYKVKAASAGSSLTFERVTDYWAADLPSMKGQNNFDIIETLFFQDPTAAFEGFKAGLFDFNAENSSKQWATGYEFPAVTEGKVVKFTPSLKNVRGMQGYAMNLRRAKFQDVRVRKALTYAFDFEWSNANLFYGQYEHSRSFFNSSELEAKGLPTPAELALLEPLKAQLPPEVFTAEYQNPKNADAGARRKNLQVASTLLTEAGWNAVDEGGKRVLKNAAGETLSIEFMLDSPLFERITLPYKEQLELLGVVVSIRTVDAAQAKKREDEFDFDIIVKTFGQSLSPGNEQRGFFGSKAADEKGSDNVCGIKNPAVDALIEKLIFVKDRQELLTAVHALDRALIWNYYLIPHWFVPYERLAYWDRFGKPDTVPGYSIGFPTTWWWDAEKAAKIAP